MTERHFAPYDGPGVTVSYDGAPFNSDYKYLVDVGYHGEIINLRTFARTPRPLTTNGKHVVSPYFARALVEIIQEQFSHENYNYEVVEND